MSLFCVRRSGYIRDVEVSVIEQRVGDGGPQHTHPYRFIKLAIYSHYGNFIPTYSLTNADHLFPKFLYYLWPSCWGVVVVYGLRKMHSCGRSQNSLIIYLWYDVNQSESQRVRESESHAHTHTYTHTHTHAYTHTHTQTHTHTHTHTHTTHTHTGLQPDSVCSTWQVAFASPSRRLTSAVKAGALPYRQVVEWIDQSE